MVLCKKRNLTFEGWVAHNASVEIASAIVIYLSGFSHVYMWWGLAAGIIIVQSFATSELLWDVVVQQVLNEHQTQKQASVSLDVLMFHCSWTVRRFHTGWGES